MVTVKTNITEALGLIHDQLKKLTDPNYLLRPVAQEQIRLMHNRIHERGLASDGNQIGIYSTGYMRTREENNRSKDTKVIISLTRQLENDYAVIATERGYGIGFNNKHNFDKANWVQLTYRKRIFDMTNSELNEAIAFINELTEQAVK